MRLEIEVVFGNEAMQTGEDAAELLTGFCELLADEGELVPGISGRLLDINGNTAGGWKVLADA